MLRHSVCICLLDYWLFVYYLWNEFFRLEAALQPKDRVDVLMELGVPSLSNSFNVKPIANYDEIEAVPLTSSCTWEYFVMNK